MNKFETFSGLILWSHTDKKCWITEVMHKVITAREEEVINVDDAHGAVTMRHMDFSQF